MKEKQGRPYFESSEIRFSFIKLNMEDKSV